MTVRKMELMSEVSRLPMVSGVMSLPSRSTGCGHNHTLKTIGKLLSLFIILYVTTRNDISTLWGAKWGKS